MGYDMYWIRKDPNNAAAEATAYEAFDAAVEVRNAIPETEKSRHKVTAGVLENVGGSERYRAAQDEVDRTYEALMRAQRSYFRLNIWGMSMCRVAMDHYGMLCGSGRSGDWPQFEDYGLHEDAWALVERVEANPCSYSEDHPARRYLAAQDRQRRLHPEGEQGIPAYKLGSNDGWVVTPEECRQALTRYEQSRAEGFSATTQEEDGQGRLTGQTLNFETDIEWWPEWLEWLRGAIEHDGFEVL